MVDKEKQIGRAKTTEETAREFVEALVAIAKSIDSDPSAEQDKATQMVRMLIGILDGINAGMPAFRVYPDPHPDDKDFHRSRGENYYDPETELTKLSLLDILRQLQEEAEEKQAEREKRKSPFPSYSRQGVPNAVLSALTGWPDGTVGYTAEMSLLKDLNAYCKSLGYGRVPQLAIQLEKLWRDPRLLQDIEASREKHLEMLKDMNKNDSFN